MKTLQDAISKMEGKGGAGQSLRKWLTAANIETWEDLTRSNLYGFRDTVLESVAPTTARTIFAYAKALLNRFADELELPKDWKKILTAKNERPLRTFLTPAELEKFEAVRTYSAAEYVVKVESLVEAFTGARVSDIMDLTAENIQGDMLTYVSKKTGVRASIPVCEKTKSWIAYAQEHREDEPTLKSRNEIIRRLCRRAGIDDTCVVYKAGETMKGPKWQFLSSHNMRISFVTNLQKAGMDMLSLSRMSGHTNTAMTERYCAPVTPELTGMASTYLGI